MATKKEIEKVGADGRKVRKKRASTAPPVERTAWLGMSAEDLARPGATLLQWLYAAANERGLNLSELADTLGVTYGYIAQLRAGVRFTKNISDEFSDACARFLGVPRIAILLAAGRVQPEDYYDSRETIEAAVKRSMHVMRNDAHWGPLVPASAATWDYATQRLVALLYERAVGKRILPEAVNMQDLIAQLKQEK